MSQSRRLPDLLTVKCFIGPRPLPRAWIGITLEVSYKNPFDFIFGPADSDGTLAVTRDQLLEEGRKMRNLAAMDYGDPEAAWSGLIEIEVLNTADIENARRAFHIYRAVAQHPPSFEHDLNETETFLKHHPDQILSARVTVLPDEAATVRLVEKRATG